MKYTNYGKQLMQPWCDLARYDLDSDTFDGTHKYEDKIRSAEDAAGWLLLTDGVYAIATVNEWIELDHATEAWGIDIRDIIAVLRTCLIEEPEITFDSKLSEATERSTQTENQVIRKNDFVME